MFEIQSLNKSFVTSINNPFEYDEMMLGVVERVQSRPKLLTALFSNSAEDVFLSGTNTLRYDDLNHTQQMPSTKRFDEYGPRMVADKARQTAYNVNSHGLTWNVSPSDFSRKRMPGTNEPMSRAYWEAHKMKKAQMSWDNFTELSFASLLTTDTNFITADGNGKAMAYNYYQTVYGVARPVAIDMQLDAVDDEHFARGQRVMNILQEQVDNAQVSMSRPIVICGSQYYRLRESIERREGFARDVRGPLDLATMEVPRDNFGSGDGKYFYPYFDSSDGFRYIDYGASILGTKLIADDKAYALPLGAETLFKRAYAPAETMSYANTTALPKYVWTHEHEKMGITGIEECNVLYFSVNPGLIIHLTSGVPLA